jgi:uncharacterized protein YjiS (DUF1127 family)
MHSYSRHPTPAALAASSSWAAAKAAAAGAVQWLRASWLAKSIFALAAAWAAERAARAAIFELRSWDDHMLRDIGLQRMDVEATVRGVHRPFRWQPDCDPAALHRLNHLA